MRMSLGICLFLMLRSSLLYSQQDSVQIFVSVEITKALKQEVVFNVSLINKMSKPISVVADTKESNFTCGLDGAFNLILEKLEDKCYETRKPDCAPLYPPPEINRRLLFVNDTLNGRFNVKTFHSITKLNGEFKFLGSYRYKIEVAYALENGNHRFASTEWFYLDFQ